MSKLVENAALMMMDLSEIIGVTFRMHILTNDKSQSSYLCASKTKTVSRNAF